MRRGERKRLPYENPQGRRYNTLVLYALRGVQPAWDLIGKPRAFTAEDLIHFLLERPPTYTIPPPQAMQSFGDLAVHTTPKNRSQHKVLIIANTIAKDAIGGTERAFIGVARQLTQHHHVPVHVIIPHYDASPSALTALTALHISASTNDTYISLADPVQWRSVFSVRDAVRRHAPTAVNLHYGGNWISLKGVLGVRLAGSRIRCVATIHHAEQIRDSHRKRTTIAAALLAHKVVVGTKQMATLLQSYGVPARKLLTIPYGYTPAATAISRQEARSLLNIQSHSFVVGSLARLVEHKGIGDLIQAVARLPRSQSPVQLIIAGDGPQRSHWEAMAESLLGPDVRFLGQIGDPSLLYAASDVFCLPSYEEGFGFVFLEAALHELACVGTAVGGIPSIVVHGQTGLLVRPGDIDAISRSITQLRVDPDLRHRLGQAAGRRAKLEMSEVAMGDRYYRVLCNY